MNSANESIVTVAIPAYNMGAYVREAVESVLASTHPHLEVLVVDDGSTDQTPAILRKYVTESSPSYDERVCVLSQSNMGKSAALNRAVATFNGAYLLILDADDVLHPEAIERLLSAVEDKDNELVAIGGFDIVVDGQRVGVRDAPGECRADILRRRFYMALKTPFSLNGCLMPRLLVERVGLFDVELRRCQDGDYAIRMLEEAQGIMTVDCSVFSYRKHRTRSSQRVALRLKTARHRAKVVRKNFPGLLGLFVMLWTLVLDIAKASYETVTVAHR